MEFGGDYHERPNFHIYSMAHKYRSSTRAPSSICWFVSTSFQRLGGKSGCLLQLNKLWIACLIFVSYAFQRRWVFLATERVVSSHSFQGGPASGNFQFHAYSAQWMSSSLQTFLNPP